MRQQLSVPSRLRYLIKKFKSPQFTILIRNRIMQTVRTDISPIPIQTHFRARRLRTSDFKHSSSHTKTSVGRNDLGASYPFGQLTTLTGCEFDASCDVSTILRVDLINLQARLIGERNSGAEVRVEVAVCREDVEFLDCFLLVLSTISSSSLLEWFRTYIASVWPCTRILHCIL
jgi:hypothetical protein